MALARQTGLSHSSLSILTLSKSLPPPRNLLSCLDATKAGSKLYFRREPCMVEKGLPDSPRLTATSSSTRLSSDKLHPQLCG